jgi:NADPH-dependent curcumin reductase
MRRPPRPRNNERLPNRCRSEGRVAVVTVNQQVRVKRMPQGVPAPADFELVQSESSRPSGGQFLCRTLWLTIDRWARLPGVGAIAPGRGVCEVIETRNDVFDVGDHVVVPCGLQQYFISDGTHAQKVHPGQTPTSTALGILGQPGMSAYFGLLHRAELRPNETVLVSAAANAAGCMAGQIALLKGARAIGITGSKEKCDWATRHARFAACINYRTDNLNARLKELAPGGVNIYFDNTGGELLERIVSGRHLATDGRVVLNDLHVPAPSVVSFIDSRAGIMPLKLQEFENRREQFLKDAIAWHGEGLLAYKEDVVDGLQNAPAQFCKLMRGENFGTPLIRMQ